MATGAAMRCGCCPGLAIKRSRDCIHLQAGCPWPGCGAGHGSALQHCCRLMGTATAGGARGARPVPPGREGSSGGERRPGALQNNAAVFPLGSLFPLYLCPQLLSNWIKLSQDAGGALPDRAGAGPCPVGPSARQCGHDWEPCPRPRPVPIPTTPCFWTF